VAPVPVLALAAALGAVLGSFVGAVAARVPDDCYYEQPNMLRIRQVIDGDDVEILGPRGQDAKD